LQYLTAYDNLAKSNKLIIWLYLLFALEYF
jgi:hypothetical protein